MRSPTLHLERVKHEEDVRYRSSSRVKAKSHHTGVARTLPSTLLLANIIMGVTVERCVGCLFTVWRRASLS